MSDPTIGHDRTVVAPVDGTAEGERALAFATVAARRLDATLELFHVVRPPPPLTVDPPLVAPTADAESLALARADALSHGTEYLAALRRRQGGGTTVRVRYVGVTHYQTSAFAELERIVAHERIDVVQLPYSVALRDAEQRLLPAARDADVAVLVNLPFGGGGLLRRLVGEPLPPAVRELSLIHI